ncbi:MAG: ABC transporter substrate-binding protein [Clostridiales bacterium]|nr:ABC transporter substrate-binding protein [Clostridiales bacterium]
MNRLFSAILATALIFMTASCASSGSPGLEKISFVLEWEPNTNHTGVYVAIANGYYADAGLEVKVLTPPETGASAFVASGKAQFGVDVQEGLGIELTLADPLPITAVAAIINHNNSGIISLKENGIDSFGKLDGKTYASWEAPAEVAILKQAIRDSGGAPDSLVTVPAPATDAISMIKTGLVDTVWVYENWDVVAADMDGLAYNYIKFADASPVLDYYTPLIIANDDFLKEKPDAARKFIQATAAGYEYAIAHPEEAAQILVDAVPELPLDFIIASQKLLSSTYVSQNEPWGVIDETRWSAFYDWMHEQGIIPEALGSRGFTNEFLLP